MRPTLVLKHSGLARHAQRIATHTGCSVVPRPASNPTLLHHGLAVASRWHLLTHEPPRKPIADLYVGSRPEAARIARLLANLFGVQLDLLDNTARPTDLKAHPTSTVAPGVGVGVNSRRPGTRRIPAGSPSGPYRLRARADQNGAAGMRRNPKARSAATFVRELRWNADAYHRGVISHAEFDRLNRATWTAIEARGARIKAAVLKALRTTNLRARALSHRVQRNGPGTSSHSGRARSRRNPPRGRVARVGRKLSKLLAGGSARVRRARDAARRAYLQATHVQRTARRITAGDSEPWRRANPKGRNPRTLGERDVRAAIAGLLKQGGFDGLAADVVAGADPVKALTIAARASNEPGRTFFELGKALWTSWVAGGKRSGRTPNRSGRNPRSAGARPSGLKHGGPGVGRGQAPGSSIAIAIGRTTATATSTASPTVHSPTSTSTSTEADTRTDTRSPSRTSTTTNRRRRSANQRGRHFGQAMPTEGLSGAIRPGDRVTYVDRFGKQHTGRAVMPSSHGGWVLNMGGRHGTPAVVDDRNIVKVVRPKGNPVTMRIAYLPANQVWVLMFGDSVISLEGLDSGPGKRSWATRGALVADLKRRGMAVSKTGVVSMQRTANPGRVGFRRLPRGNHEATHLDSGITGVGHTMEDAAADLWVSLHARGIVRMPSAQFIHDVTGRGNLPGARRRGNPKGQDPELDEAVRRIRTGLQRRGGARWSVTRGTGSVYGWIYIKSPRGDMTPDEQRYLAKLLGLETVHHQGVMIPSGGRERSEYVARAEGRAPNPRLVLAPGERVSIPYFGRSRKLTHEKATVIGHLPEGVHVQIRKGKTTSTRVVPEDQVRRLPKQGPRAARDRVASVQARLEMKAVRERHRDELRTIARIERDIDCAEAQAKQGQPYAGETPSPAYRALRSKLTRLGNELAAHQAIAAELARLDPAIPDPLAAFNPPRMPRKQRRAVASGRFVQAQHYAARSVARGAARFDRGRAARPRRRTRNPKRPIHSPAVRKAEEQFRKWQDRGPIAVRHRTERAPAPLRDAAAELGKLVAVTYRTDKYDGKVKDHEHVFKAPLASVVTDPDGRDLHIVRGRSKYAVTSDGITN